MLSREQIKNADLFTLETEYQRIKKAEVSVNKTQVLKQYLGALLKEIKKRKGEQNVT